MGKGGGSESYPLTGGRVYGRGVGPRSGRPKVDVAPVTKDPFLETCSPNKSSKGGDPGVSHEDRRWCYCGVGFKDKGLRGGGRRHSLRPTPGPRGPPTGRVPPAYKRVDVSVWFPKNQPQGTTSPPSNPSSPTIPPLQGPDETKTRILDFKIEYSPRDPLPGKHHRVESSR